MRALLLVLPVAAVLVTAVFLAVNPFAEGRNADQEANRRVLEEMNHPPGTQVLGIEDNPYFSERGPILSNIPIGWTLNVTMQPPEGSTAADVLAFYEQNPPEGWRVSAEETPHLDLATGRQTGFSKTVIYRRDSAVVAINVDNLGASGPGTYEIGIDHRQAR
jgi:hypothetical protein